jgi:hypothetical protein
VRAPTPKSGNWHAAIDMQGLRGSTRAGVQVIPANALGPLPPIQQNRPMLQDIAQNVAEMTSVDAAEGSREYDVFISHATEDKEEVVRPLAHALRRRDLMSGTTSSSYASATACGARSTQASLAAASALSCSRRPSSPRAGRSTNWTA